MSQDFVRKTYTPTLGCGCKPGDAVTCPCYSDFDIPYCECPCHSSKTTTPNQDTPAELDGAEPARSESPLPLHTFTVDAFHQLPHLDYLDTETGRPIPNTSSPARVVWKYQSHLLFSILTEPETETGAGELGRPIYRYLLNPSLPHDLFRHADSECRRLTHIIEALTVRDSQWSRLPLKLKVRGETYYSPLYTHPCPAVRYPMMGLDGDVCGKAKLRDIQSWLTPQGFPDPLTTPGQVEGIMDSILQDTERRDKEWKAIIQSLLSLPQTFLIGQSNPNPKRKSPK
jgi:hypothetical protein